MPSCIHPRHTFPLLIGNFCPAPLHCLRSFPCAEAPRPPQGFLFPLQLHGTSLGFPHGLAHLWNLGTVRAQSELICFVDRIWGTNDPASFSMLGSRHGKEPGWLYRACHLVLCLGQSLDPVLLCCRIIWKVSKERSNSSSDSLHEERNEPEIYLHTERSWAVEWGLPCLSHKATQGPFLMLTASRYHSCNKRTIYFGPVGVTKKGLV